MHAEFWGYMPACNFGVGAKNNREQIWRIGILEAQDLDFPADLSGATETEIPTDAAQTELSVLDLCLSTESATYSTISFSYSACPFFRTTLKRSPQAEPPAAAAPRSRPDGIAQSVGRKIDSCLETSESSPLPAPRTPAPVMGRNE